MARNIWYQIPTFLLGDLGLITVLHSNLPNLPHRIVLSMKRTMYMSWVLWRKSRIKTKSDRSTGKPAWVDIPKLGRSVAWFWIRSSICFNFSSICFNFSKQWYLLWVYFLLSWISQVVIPPFDKAFRCSFIHQIQLELCSTKNSWSVSKKLMGFPCWAWQVCCMSAVCRWRGLRRGKGTRTACELSFLPQRSRPKAHVVHLTFN